MRWWVLVFSLVCIAWPAAAQKPRITMLASSARVAVGEPFTLEIRADVSGEEVEDLEVPDLGNLEVLGQRVARPTSFSFSFGTGGQQARVESHIVHSYTLRALTPGKHVLAPAILTVGGRKIASQGVTIEAVGAAAVPGTQVDPNALQAPPGTSLPPEGPLSGAHYDNDLFLRTVVDKNRAYVGEQVTTSIYLYVRGGLTQNPTITREATTEGFWVQDLLGTRTPEPARQEVNGRVFRVYVLRRYAAFPLRAGKLKIGAPAIEVSSGPSIFDLITGPTTPVRRNGVSADVEVLDLPRSSGTAPTHVGTLALEASVDPGSAKVGDAVTLRVVAKGLGNLKALQFANPQLADAEVLQPEIDDRVALDLDQVGGERIFKWLILPRKPGVMNIAPFAVDVFDPQSKSYQRVQTKSISVQVSGVAMPAPTAAAANEPAEQKTADKLELPPLRLSASLERARPPLSDASWYGWAVAAAPLLLLGWSVGQFAARRIAAKRAAQPGNSELQAAEQKLTEATAAARAQDHAKVYGSLLGALRASLQARLGESVGGLTLVQLRERCIVRGMAPPLAERVVAELAACEEARFDPSRQAVESLDRHLAEARQLVADISRFRAREAA